MRVLRMGQKREGERLLAEWRESQAIALKALGEAQEAAAEAEAKADAYGSYVKACGRHPGEDLGGD